MPRIRSRPGNQYWSTQTEIKFLTDLGSHSDLGKQTTKIRLLKGYLEGSRKRERWENIDQDAVIQHAQNLYDLYAAGR